MEIFLNHNEHWLVCQPSFSLRFSQFPFYVAIVGYWSQNPSSLQRWPRDSSLANLGNPFAQELWLARGWTYGPSRPSQSPPCIWYKEIERKRLFLIPGTASHVLCKWEGEMGMDGERLCLEGLTPQFQVCSSSSHCVRVSSWFLAVGVSKLIIGNNYCILTIY